MSGVRIAGVAAPDGNAFIFEILEAVASEVRALGGDAIAHKGTVADVDDGNTAFLIVPHEYYWFNPRPSPEHLRRTIALDTEHPGTGAFEVSSRVAQVVGAVFEISTDSVQELERRGVRSELFTIGYNGRWDTWHGEQRQRSVDLTYMAAADPERVQALARLAPDLAGINANLLVPPYEQRVAARPDFLVGEQKWNFLADTNLLLNLHREAKTALELIRVVEAICNGCVVLTEPSTGLGGLVPGTHLLVSPRETIAHEAQRVLADPGLLREIRHNAYEYCKRELSMRASAQRLIEVAEQVVRRAQAAGPPAQLNMPDWPEQRPPFVPELAPWVPEPYPLPAPGAALAPGEREAIGELLSERRERMALHDIHSVTATPGALVDVLITRTRAGGSLTATLASLDAQQTPLNVHVAGIGIPIEAELDVNYLTCSYETSIGAARNELIERSAAPNLLFLEAGDELFEGTLTRMLARLEAEPDAELIYTMAAFGDQTVVNLFHPEPARLEKHAYLTRGFLARRRLLETLGTFAEDPSVEAYVDHDFWTRVAAAPSAKVVHLHQIGMRLEPLGLAQLQPFDPSAIRDMLSHRVGGHPPLPPAAAPPGRSAPHSNVAAGKLPKVSALMGAYNYASYIVEAIESCMGQEYPPELLELVIVDDGSSDNTAELVQAAQERHPGRIKFIQQENAGATAATNRARREASGDLIALLDADDVWLPHKTRRQVDFMLRRPDLGLSFTRMQLVDADGKTTFRNYGYQGPIPENGFARVLWENVAVQSSLIIEAELFDQIPDEAPYADWWLSLVAAQFKKVDYIPDDLVLYRWHGANLTGGVGGIKALREAQKGIDFQRWVLRSFELGEFTDRLSPEDMWFVWSGLENQAAKGLRGMKSYFGRLTVATDADREDAARDAAEAERSIAAGDFVHGCALLLRACACNPFDFALRTRLEGAVEVSKQFPSPPDPLSGHTGFTALAEADYLLADDSRLLAYAEAMSSVPEAALAIDASQMEADEAAEQLGALVTRCGLADSAMLMFGLVGELKPSQLIRVRRAVDAVYGDSPAALMNGEGAARAVPVFNTGALVALRDLAATPRQAGRLRRLAEPEE
jgi:glycosyltransferase involved in cell wall biosynthesis